MIKYIKTIAFAALIGITSCSDDFLTADPTASQEAGGPATEGAIRSNVAAAYQLLLFDSYADNNYNSIVLMSDLRSDDIFKGGGDAGDQGQLYRLSQFDASPDELPGGLWTIYYNGLSRSNNAISACENAVDVDPATLDRLNAEAHFLRAYYVHWLWKFWGNIPYFEEELPEPYLAPQYTADEIYAQIIEDVNFAIADDKLPMTYSGQDANSSDYGHVTKAAAMMLKARVVMYQKDESKYAEVLADMATIINSGAFELVNDFAEIWPTEGEFNSESIFEVVHLDGEYDGKTWDSGWHGYGTNLPAFISPNALPEESEDLLSGKDVYKGGWGFGPVRPDVVEIYEDGDERLAASINEFEEGSYTARFQNTGYFMAKYAARVDYNEPPGDVDLNYENNLRIFRYAETLLNAAELMGIHGVPATDGLTAQWCLDQIRIRANMGSIPANAENIKLERRREFVGEGMRFWDVVRWGDTQVLNDNLPEYSSERTWEPSEKYLPIPQSEINRTLGTEYPLEQNPY
ncbi:RagB/SusD family nutrient uptake outer membrane protein [Marinilabilia sp.]|uniref:RagB/SusD family nutrient uptake outer membrane protein n=1 Tax=Marinilabilia sp. TaxID=2021252 RepID=UPI0025BC6934|nr:RagB/SusD family nutrient uptake outer membrane protein [Marinilabilia sp.]